MKSWHKALPYFTRDELACRATGILKLDYRFAAALPALRLAWGKPLHPNSVCRAPEYNASDEVDGHPTSLHLTENPKHPTWGCMAADFQWRHWTPEAQLRFARLAWKMGWSVGLHDGFCHVDRRKDIGLRQAVFLYGTWSGAFDPEDIF